MWKYALEACFTKLWGLFASLFKVQNWPIDFQWEVFFPFKVIQILSKVIDYCSYLSVSTHTATSHHAHDPFLFSVRP